MPLTISLRTTDTAAFDAALALAKERGFTEIRNLGEFTVWQFSRLEPPPPAPPPPKPWWDKPTPYRVRAGIVCDLYAAPGAIAKRTLTDQREMDVYEVKEGGWLRVTQSPLALWWVRAEQVAGL